MNEGYEEDEYKDCKNHLPTPVSLFHIQMPGRAYVIAPNGYVSQIFLCFSSLVKQSAHRDFRRREQSPVTSKFPSMSHINTIWISAGEVRLHSELLGQYSVDLVQHLGFHEAAAAFDKRHHAVIMGHHRKT